MSADLKWLVITIVWTSLATIFAWLGISRLRVANAAREFDFFFRGLHEAEWPFAFQAAKAFLAVWTVLACIMVAIGCVLLLKAVVGLIQ